MMKSLFACVAAYLFAIGCAFAGEGDMKVRFVFEGGEVVVRMEKNPAAERMLEMLPASFEFIDFAGEEKIAEFPAPLSLEGAPRGMKALAGRMFVYEPWGNLGIFYKEHGRTTDKNLIPLGEVESGLEYLISRKGGFRAEAELIKQ